MATPNGDDDQVYVAILILLCGVVVIGLLGPIGLLVAGVTIVIGAIAGLGHAGGAVVTLVGAGMGVVLVDPTDWLMGPMKDMAEIYRVYLFDGWTWDTDGLWAYYGKLLAHAPAWNYFSPLGVFAGGITTTAWQLYWSSPLRRTARGKPPKAERPSWRAWWASRSMPTVSAAVESGTFMGIDKMSGRHVEISDELDFAAGKSAPILTRFLVLFDDELYRLLLAYAEYRLDDEEKRLVEQLGEAFPGIYAMIEHLTSRDLIADEPPREDVMEMLRHGALRDIDDDDEAIAEERLF